jgi:hypothetical protein
MSSCTSCGARASGEASFCAWCGARLPDSGTQEPALPGSGAHDPGAQEPALYAPAHPDVTVLDAGALDSAGESWLLDPDGPSWSPEVPERTSTRLPPPRRAGPSPPWSARIGLLAGAVLVGVLGGGGAALFARTPAPNSTAQSGYQVSTETPTPSKSPSKSPSASPSPKKTDVPAEEVAARGLSALLAQSSGDRSAVVDAAGDVEQCGQDLAGDPGIFTRAVASRQRLLTRLANLTDVSALPAGMVQALTGAWQASVQADQDYATWAQDENSGHCKAGGADPNRSAATAPADQANTDKVTFLNLWNPIATRYGLRTYQWSQL